MQETLQYIMVENIIMSDHAGLEDCSSRDVFNCTMVYIKIANRQIEVIYHSSYNFRVNDLFQYRQLSSKTTTFGGHLGNMLISH